MKIKPVAAVLSFACVALLSAQEVSPEDAPERRLYASVISGSIAELGKALEDGADIDALLGDPGHTALEWALIRNKRDIFMFLLDRGANHAITGRDHIFHLIARLDSCDPGYIDILAERGISPAVSDARGTSPFMLACATGHFSVAERLLEASEKAGISLDGPGILRAGNNAFSGIHVEDGDMAARRRLAQALLKMGLPPDGAHDGMRYLSIAIFILKDPEMTRILLAAGADANGPGGGERTPLMESEDPECTRQLLLAGADVNARNDYGFTALTLSENRECRKLLIEAGADVNARARHGETPLMLSRDPEYSRMLVAAGADVNAVDESGHSAFYRHLFEYGDIELAGVCLEAGASPYVRSPDGKNAFLQFVSTELPSRVAFRDREKMILDFARRLATAGIRPDECDRNGISAVSFVINNDKVCRGYQCFKGIIGIFRDSLGEEAFQAAVDEAARLAKKDKEETESRERREITGKLGYSFIAILIPAVHTAASISAQAYYGAVPDANWMGSVNSALTMGCVFGLGGGLLTLPFTSTGSSGLAGAWEGIGNVMLMFVGTVIGSICGIIVGLLPEVSAVFNKIPPLYYAPVFIAWIPVIPIIDSIWKEL